MLNIVPLLLAAASPTSGATAIDMDMASHAAVLTVHAEGAQIYECKAGQGGALQWTFREPIASLMVDGRTTGRHYAGPHWALDDGSIVKGKAIMTAPGATDGDVPLLKLEVVEHQGTGALTQAVWVYRVKTHGGALTGACGMSGALKAVAYSADYVFAR